MRADRATRSRVWKLGLIGAAAAVNVGIFTISRVADVTFVVPGFGRDAEAMTVAVGQVLFMSIVPFVLGMGVAALAVSRGRSLFGIQVAGGVLALSIGLPLSLDPEIAEISTRVVLATMHLVAGATFVITLGFARRRGVREPNAVEIEERA